MTRVVDGEAERERGESSSYRDEGSDFGDRVGDGASGGLTE